MFWKRKKANHREYKIESENLAVPARLSDWIVHFPSLFCYNYTKGENHRRNVEQIWKKKESDTEKKAF